MKSTIKLEGDNGVPIAIEYGTFPGGEVRVKVLKIQELVLHEQLTIVARLRCAEGIQVIAQLKSIIDFYQMTKGPIVYLVLGYAPYARQDRVCSEGEALAAKVFADQINNLNFTKVVTIDNHSDVMGALLHRSADLDKESIFALDNFYKKYDVYIAPDYGASKEVQKLARLHGKLFVQGIKHRDPATGNLSGFEILCEAGFLDGKSVLVVDDLCDGGGTFVGLADVITDKHTLYELGLYVSHGILSKGTDELLNLYDDIYTTDTLIDSPHDFDESDVTIIKIMEL